MMIYMAKEDYETTKQHYGEISQEFFHAERLEIKSDRMIYIDNEPKGYIDEFVKMAICQSTGFIPVIVNHGLVLNGFMRLCKPCKSKEEE